MPYIANCHAFEKPPLKDPSDRNLDFGVPKAVLAAVLVFAAVNLASILGLHGIADPEGYVLNPSRQIPVNTHEDDGHLNITAMLGHLKPGQSKFSYYFNIGGPFLHLATGAAAIGDALGLVKRFDDKTIYWLYPEELKRAWQFFGMVKLAFIIWLPIVVFWFGNNHFSRRAGLAAAWLVVAMPLIPGFEQRMKVDSVVIGLGLLSMLFQVAYARWGRTRDLYAGAAALAVSLSMKFVMLPALPVFLGCYLLGQHARGERALSRTSLARAAIVAGLALVVFIAANPRFIPGILVMARDYAQNVTAAHRAASPYGFWDTMLARLTTFGPLAGSWSDAAALPVLAFSALACLLGRKAPWRTGLAALLSFFLLDILYLYCFVGAEGVRTLTYYFFAAALVLCMLAAFALDRLASSLPVPRRLSGFAMFTAVCVLALISFRQQAAILDYSVGPTNRQLALAWLDGHLPADATIGVPLPPGGVALNNYYWVDPFRHAVLPLGAGLEQLEESRPDFVLRVLDSKARQSAIPPGYEQAAVFERGDGLSGDGRRDMFQDEAYQILRRTAPGPAIRKTTPEKRIFQRLEADPEPVFNLMTWKSTSLYPISLEMFRKWGERVTPFPIRAFASSIREGGVLDYVHQIPPECLTLWGVKYLLAPAPDGGPLRTETLASGLYPLAPVTWTGAGKDGPSLFRNEGYLGQAVFIPRSAPLDARQASPSPIFPGRGRLPLYGDLAPAAGADGPRLVEVAFALETDQPVDMILSDGSRKQSVVVGPGYHATSLPLRPGPKGVRYEINPVSAPARAILHSIEVRPMELVGPPAVQAGDLSPRRAAARVDVPAPGRVVFALPWHGYWQAEVDGKPARAQRGPGNTVAVEVPGGSHGVLLQIK